MIEGARAGKLAGRRGVSGVQVAGRERGRQVRREGVSGGGEGVDVGDGGTSAGVGVFKPGDRSGAMLIVL